ncbi:MAG TPA: inositol monophosphatase family protein [Mycobacteriales bacterium]|nr:inositol monophosphatase family protein [Mycobacteriales bacterium]HVX68752.1 inositol monophosphatase family protein [Mycobacteriales bacterium]
MTDSRSDSELARDLATSAGQLLLKLRADKGFSDPWKLRDAGDHDSNVHLLELLAEARPDDIVLSEESADDARRHDADRLWIIDPLDGTTEYGEPERTDWAVHVALWQRGRGLTDGAVALPARGMTLSTAEALPTRGEPASHPRLAVSRTRRPPWVVDVAEKVSGQLVPIGSAGMKAMSIVLGETDAYLHSGRMKEWDSAAPVVVAVAAGLHVSQLDGSELEFNKPSRLTEQLLICHPSLTDALVAASVNAPV